jgi:hypothetical protein
MEEKELERQPCLVYSRVCGYLVPSNQYNPGKLSEFEDRSVYNVDEIINE